ncbi:Rho-related GTP-binding protein RhoA-A [Astathelohania contejeani]|uniref:Rho-related GTP-binding protein RhoA-A n=1 Tax=Astathelohania contejeani TaxID=164912 RepID=A0ABQ7I201_9MICR|nr:Rho-related GTP-binding protein RhoA-A [Thelohania contejeani]
MSDQNRLKTSGKVVVVGDGACGKTCLLEVFKRNKFPDEYIPTVVDNFVKEVEVGENTKVTLTLWDTAGQEDYDSVRPLSYKDTDLVIICYSIENKDFLPNISGKWVYEIKNYCPTAGFFLVGLKKDMRDDETGFINKERLVTYEEGKNIAGEIGAKKFYECSAKTGENVDIIFKDAGKYIMELKKTDISRSRKWYFCFCC